MTEKRYRARVVTERTISASSQAEAEEKLRGLMDDEPFELKELVEVEDAVLYRCDDCGSDWTEDEVVSLSGKRMLQSVAPGEIVPQGECPENGCAALVYPPPALCSVVDKHHLEHVASLAHTAYYSERQDIRGEFLKIVRYVIDLLGPPAHEERGTVQPDCTDEDPLAMSQDEAAGGAAAERAKFEALDAESGFPIAWSEAACPRGAYKDMEVRTHRYANECVNMKQDAGSTCKCPCHRLAHNK